MSSLRLPKHSHQISILLTLLRVTVPFGWSEKKLFFRWTEIKQRYRVSAVLSI